MEQGFVIRTFAVETDLPRLMSLLSCAEAVDRGGTNTSREALSEQLSLPGQQDRWVIQAPDDPERLIGYGMVWQPPEQAGVQVYAAVHPDWRGRGLGEALLSHCIERARAWHAVLAEAYVNERPAASHTFLRARGFTPVGAYTEMRAAGNLALAAPTWPDGFIVRSYAEIQHLPTLTEAFNRAYAGQPGHNVVTDETMRGFLPELLPEGLLLLFDPNGAVAGICRVEPNAERTARNSAPTGYIDSPGLVPEHRTLELRRALLSSAVHWLRARGQVILELESWGDDDETLDLYRQVGFETLRRKIEYGRKLNG